MAQRTDPLQLHRDLRRAREGKGHQVGRHGPRLEQPRLRQSEGDGHDPHEAHDDQRPGHARRRHAAPLLVGDEVCYRRQRERPFAQRRRPQFLHPGIQGLPRQP